jgi:hypothetical protein
MAAAIFVHCKKKPADAAKIVAAFASRAIAVQVGNVRVLRWREGLPDAGQPRKIAFVNPDNDTQIGEALKLEQITWAGETYFLAPAHKKTPPSKLASFQPRGEHFKPYRHDEFREE